MRLCNTLNKLIAFLLILTSTVSSRVTAGSANVFASLRYPAVPLVTHDPFTSCWSTSSNLYDSWPKHWTMANHAMCGLIRIDAQTKRFIGTAEGVHKVIPQRSVFVKATQSIYTFRDEKIELKVTFCSPLLMDDLGLLSRPVSYIDFQVSSVDGKSHDVQIYFDASAEWAVHSTAEEVVWERMDVPGQCAMKIGTKAQPVLRSSGDDHRINWGHLLASASKKQASSCIGSLDNQRSLFAKSGNISDEDEPSIARAASDRWPGLSLRYNLGKVSGSPVKRYLMIGYDDLYSIQYFGKNLKAWWKRNGMTAGQMLTMAEKEHEAVIERCGKFDLQLRSDALEAGGEKYADLCELVYREAMAAHKLVEGPDGELLYFSKENNSNGSIGTVDCTYPSAPLFLLYNTDLLKGMLEFIFYYAESGKWTKDIAPHDVGTYPLANGQTYPYDMPVEECGNMLILTYAIAFMDGNVEYAKQHWKCLTQWAAYLEEEGYNPDYQLSTDDFGGRLEQNCNLSIKAILGIASYGKLAGMIGDKDTEKKYMNKAGKFASKWEQEAFDGDHYKMTFHGEGTWSQKYNLVWDKLLGFNLFSGKVAETEVAWYIKNQYKYGIPLDCRNTFTKSDWIIWSATLAQSDDDFKKLAEPVWWYVNDCDRRSPVGDWHEATNAHANPMYARSVIAGYFMKMLSSKMSQNMKIK